MPRADVRTFAWMLPLTLALVIAWMFWANPYFKIHAARRAAKIVLVAMGIVGLIGSIAYAPDFPAPGSLIMLAVCLVGAAIAWLSATLTLRWRRRG